MKSENESLEYGQDIKKLLESKKHRKRFLLKKNYSANDDLESVF
jgi:hypothetical protein